MCDPSHNAIGPGYRVTDAPDQSEKPMEVNLLSVSDDGNVDRILERHLVELRGVKLTDETLAANGVYSETDPDKIAKLLNWPGSAKQLGPVLVFPYFDRDGQPLDHVTVKPDRPRDDKKKLGKKIKYENPKGPPNRVYIPVCARHALADPKADLFLSEGCKKALAATQNGFPCLSLPGVWGWCAKRKQKNGKKVGRHELNADLAGISWLGRVVYIVFDSDAIGNPNVGKAEHALAAVLRRHGADVRIVRLPAEPDGSKNGLDDFLARHGAEEFRKLVEAAHAPTDSVYSVTRGCTYLFDKKLANFSAQIVGETVTDDGAEQTHEFSIEAKRANTVKTVNVPVERFGSLDWVIEKLGPKYVIMAGMGNKDHLRCAIQEMSDEDLPTTTVFTYTGWREIEGQWVYLHGDGAIGETTPIEVRLEGPAAGFRLPQPPQADDLRAAVRASLGLLDGLVADHVAFPLLVAVYGAPLGSPDYSVWMTGPTGVQKSELAALAQQHFGAEMNRTRLPGNWSSTDNALEGLAFVIKDAPLVIDDFAPATSKFDAERQQRVAERLIRGQGNHSGKQRMRADCTLRPPKPPRGLIIATGEDIPRGHSILARLCIIQVQKGNVDLKRLSQCQGDATKGLYAAAMAGYIEWLASQYQKVRDGLGGERVKLRDQFLETFPHARTPDVIANQMLGLQYLLRFAKQIGAIDKNEEYTLLSRGQNAFQAVAEQQGEHQREVDPVARFPELVATIISSGRGHIAGADGKEPGIPPSPTTWGWEERVFHAGDGKPGTNYHGRGNKIGWVVGDVLYLDPDATYAAIVELSRHQGQTYPINKETLYRRLKESRALLRTEKDRTTAHATLEGRRIRVLHLSVPYMFGKVGQLAQPGQVPSDSEKNVPVSCASFSTAPQKLARKTGTP